MKKYFFFKSSGFYCRSIKRVAKNGCFYIIWTSCLEHYWTAKEYFDLLIFLIDKFHSFQSHLLHEFCTFESPNTSIDLILNSNSNIFSFYSFSIMKVNVLNMCPMMKFLKISKTKLRTQFFFIFLLFLDLCWLYQ